MFCNEPYNYFESVKKDAIDAIDDLKESYPYFYDLLKGEGKNDEEKKGLLDDFLRDRDDVTGNSCGSRFCCRRQAEECLLGNWDLVREAAELFGYENEKIGEMFLSGDFEAIDVIVRCFVLYDVINDLVDNKEVDL